MISIKFRRKDSVNVLYDKLFACCKGKSVNAQRRERIRQNIDDWCRKNLNNRSFESIVKADYEELVRIKNEYDKIGSNSVNLPKFPASYKKFILESLYRDKFPRQKFVEELQVTVCPYCNRNFINSTYKRTMCDLEHFFDKASYPVLAVSFYNLIPVCHPCNHVKASNRISCSPHDLKLHTDDLLTFDYFIKGPDFLTDKEQIGIEIDCTFEFEDNVRVLKLNDVYQIHTDLVQECIKKSIVFNSDYLEDLCQTYDRLFESKEDLYRIVFGNYKEETEYGKRPLSKLTKDILSSLYEDIYME